MLYNSIGQIVHESVPYDETTGRPLPLGCHESLEIVSRQQNGYDVEAEITRVGNAHFLYKSILVLPAEKLKPRAALSFSIEVTPRNYRVFLGERYGSQTENLDQRQEIEFESVTEARNFTTTLMNY